MTAERPIGLVLGGAIAPQHIQGAAATAETCGFDEIWLAEDYFFSGGISGAALVLGATSHITVGLGVVSAVARHPALLAMELSTLSRVYGGRLIAGIGLGVPAWVRQMGLHPRSPLSALRECVTAIKAKVIPRGARCPPARCGGELTGRRLQNRSCTTIAAPRCYFTLPAMSNMGM